MNICSQTQMCKGHQYCKNCFELPTIYPQSFLWSWREVQRNLGLSFPPALCKSPKDLHRSTTYSRIPLLSQAPQALTCLQMWDISPLPFTSKPLPSLSFPSRTTRAIVFYSLCVLLCGKIPEPREHKTWPLFRDDRRERWGKINGE